MRMLSLYGIKVWTINLYEQHNFICIMLEKNMYIFFESLIYHIGPFIKFCLNLTKLISLNKLDSCSVIIKGKLEKV